MPSNQFDWRLTADECITARSEENGLETCKRLYIRYSDPTTGEEGAVHAVNQPDGYPLLEKAFPPAPLPAASLTRAEAQALADEAIAVLGGEPVARWWVQVSGNRLLDCSDGDQRPAKLIADGDRVIWNFAASMRDEALRVIGVTSESAGVMLLSLSDRDDHGRRADLELRLNSL